MDKPTYKIHGIKRRKLKKELSKLKRYVRDFWYYHQLDKDMTSFYGGKEGFPMSDDEAQKIVDKTKKKIEQLEDKLSVLSDSSESEHLVDFLLHLNDKKLINNHDFDYEKEAKKYLKILRSDQ